MKKGRRAFVSTVILGMLGGFIFLWNHHPGQRSTNKHIGGMSEKIGGALFRMNRTVRINGFPLEGTPIYSVVPYAGFPAGLIAHHN